MSFFTLIIKELSFLTELRGESNRVLCDIE